MSRADIDEWADWIDAEDVYRKMKIAPRTLQRWRINGLLPYSRLNGKCYYKKSDILKLLEDNYNGGKGGEE